MTAAGLGSIGPADLLAAWWPLALTALVAAAAAITVAAAAAWRSSRVAVVDVAWGIGFVLVALAGAVVGGAVEGSDGLRRGLLAAAVAVWGLRLAWHIRARAQGHHEDPRYAELLGVTPEEDRRAWFALGVRKVFLVQCVALWVVSWPVQVGQALPVAAGWLVVLGLVVTGAGVVFESLGDAQLAAYKARPREERPAVMDTGLWRWTRHPNYFGDACVWWGIWLVAADSPFGVLTVVSPVLMTWLLARGTGKPLLERDIADRRPGYADYVRRTSGFVPLPPGRGTDHETTRRDERRARLRAPRTAPVRSRRGAGAARRASRRGRRRTAARRRRR